MTYRGHVQNGAVVLDEPADLAEGAQVAIVVGACKNVSHETERRTLHERLQPFIGMANGLPPDGSRNLDHYLYGAPKK
jgi:hypothetical protein